MVTDNNKLHIEHALSFNKAQIILSKEDTSGKHTLTPEQIGLVAKYCDDVEAYTTTSQTKEASIEKVVIKYTFDDKSIIRQLL